MRSRIVPALVLGATLLAAVAGDALSPALAQGCQAVNPLAAGQSGQVIPLGNLRSRIQAATGGQMIDATLCNFGGRLVYRVQVLIGGRQAIVNIDAASGAPMN